MALNQALYASLKLASDPALRANDIFCRTFRFCGGGAGLDNFLFFDALCVNTDSDTRVLLDSTFRWIFRRYPYYTSFSLNVLLKKFSRRFTYPVNVCNRYNGGPATRCIAIQVLGDVQLGPSS
jgi:hypothetical protein